MSNKKLGGCLATELTRNLQTQMESSRVKISDNHTLFLHYMKVS